MEASALYYSLIETAKANGTNVYDYLWHVLSEAPGCKTEEDFDRLLPWNIDDASLTRMRNLRDSGKPDHARIEPYLFRGARLLTIVNGRLQTGLTWFSISRILDDITAGLIETKSSTLWYTSQISDEAKNLFSKLSLKVPGKVLEVDPKV